MRDILKLRVKSSLTLNINLNLNRKILSATVISDSAIKSGVYSTALMVNPNLDIDLEKILIDEELKVLN